MTKPMQAQDHDIKALHQRASSHYLRGEFRQALEVWQGVIELDPEDERAKEGVRLCELLVQEGAEAQQEPAPAADSVAVQPAPRSPFSGAAEGFDQDLDELDEILESGLGSAPAAQAAPEAPSAPAPEEEQAAFFDFSNVPDLSEAGSDSPGDAADELSAPDLEPGDFGDGASLPVGEAPAEDAVIERHSQSADDTEEAPTQPDGAQEAAAAELRSRVNELLAEALTAYEHDHKEEALAILNRIFILDENNHAALALHDNIRVELEAERSATEAASEEQPSVESAEEPLPAPEGEAAEPLTDENADDEIRVVEPDPRPSPPPRAQRPAEQQYDELEDTASAIAEASEKRRLLSEALLTRQNMLLVATLVVVVGVGGFLAFTFMRGSGGTSAAETQAASLIEAGVPPPAVAVVLSEGEGDAEVAAQPAAPQEAAPADPAPQQEDPAALARRLEELLAQAQQAMERSDWSAAVLAFNQALEIDPANPAARDGLAEAGDRYREEKAMEQKYREAIDAFRDGNYRAALTLFYRLPADEDQQRIDRYKRNGWYNMGIQALAVGDCGSATTHLKEARAIDPQDRETLLALDLAKDCPYSRDTEAFRSEVRQLPLRRLDD